MHLVPWQIFRPVPLPLCISPPWDLPVFWSLGSESKAADCIIVARPPIVVRILTRPKLRPFNSSLHLWLVIYRACGTFFSPFFPPKGKRTYSKGTYSVHSLPPVG